MREQVLAVIVAAATFGVVNGAIVGVGLAVTERADSLSAFAAAEPQSRNSLFADVRTPRVAVKAPS